MSRGVVDPGLRGDDVSGAAEAGHGSTLRSATEDRLLELIRVSLATWGVEATVYVEAEARWSITIADGRAIHVGRAPGDIPFRWLVTTTEGRQRPASSVAGLLRVLRSTLSPDWRSGRARIVPLALPEPNVRP